MEDTSKNSHKRGRRVGYIYTSKKNTTQKQSSEAARRKILEYFK